MMIDKDYEVKEGCNLYNEGKCPGITDSGEAGKRYSCYPDASLEKIANYSEDKNEN